MKKSSLLICLIWGITAAFGQSNIRNSLWAKFSDAKEDTAKVLLLAQLSDVFSADVSPDSAFLLGQRGLKLAESIGYRKGAMKCRISIARAAQWLGDYETTIKLGYSVLEYANAQNDSSLMADAIGELADGYQDAGDFKESIRWASKSFDLANKSDKSNYSAVWLASIGSSYYGMGRYDSSFVYLKKALSYPDAWGIGYILLTMGRTLEKSGNKKAAFEYYHQSIKDLSRSNNSNDLAGAYTSIARLFLKIGETDSCIYYANLGLTFALQKQFRKEILDAYLVLSDAYEKINTTDALKYYKLAMNAKDKLYNVEKQRQVTSFKFNEELRQNEIKSAESQFKNRLRIYILSGILGLFIILTIALIRNSKNKHKANLKIQKAYSDLKSTQAQLIQSEKMASLGELTAGIAHEIQNPLNFVNNFSEVSRELVIEMNDELAVGNWQLAKEISGDIEQNLEKINHHGKRADAIVKGMLQHSRSSTGFKEPTDINTLADEYLRLANHGLRAKDKDFNATLKTDFDETIGKIDIVPQDIGRVILNLITNAFYAVDENKKQAPLPPKGGIESPQDHYEPTVTVSTKLVTPPLGGPGAVKISVKDNGPGIPQKVLDKIFQPFFTTKPTGQGTGLGLSLAYDIVKAHGGELKVETKEGDSSEFIILLPINPQ
jgi:two-component system, NtrC family, sensor kinase